MGKFITYKLKNIIILLVLLLNLFIAPKLTYAMENSLDFYVTPIFTENQLNESDRYFNLNAEPGSIETLTLKLENANDRSKKIQITPHTAFTNTMGVVEYGADAEIPDPTLPYSLKDLIETPEIVELAGNETKNIEISLNMPQATFSGLLAGGLRISEHNDKEREKEEDGVAINNEFAYVVGIVASNDRSTVQADLELHDVFADQLNYRNVISANIQNFTPTFVNRLEVEATVQKKGEDNILYEAKKEQMQMAPNSNFNFPISLEGDRFRSGEYTLNLIAKSGEEEWKWERDFTIDANEARALNRADVTIDTGINWWIIVSVSLIVLLLLIIIWLLIKKRIPENGEEVKHDENKKSLGRGKH